MIESLRYLRYDAVAGPVIQANGRLTFEDDTPASALSLPTVRSLWGNLGVMAIGFVEFSREGYKIRKIFA